MTRRIYFFTHKGDSIMSNDKTKSLTRRKFLAQVGTSTVALNVAAGLRASASAANAAASPSIGLRTSEKTVNIGVVGGGFGSHFQWHLDPSCKVVAVCDLREDRLKRLTEAY